MRKLKCPQCKISNLFIKNGAGERRLIVVLEDFSIVPAKDGETLDGFLTDTIYCLGCSWNGTVRKLTKY